MNKEYKIILNDDLYDEKIDESNNKTYYLQNDLNDVFNDSSKSITLKVTGILRPKKDASVISMNPGLCYNSDLIEYVNSKMKSQRLQLLSHQIYQLRMNLL